MSRYGCGVTKPATSLVTVAAALLVALTIAACGQDINPPLAFKFVSKGPTGSIDQTLTIRNREDSALAGVLKMTPLDAAGKKLTGVAVHTAFGSDRGLVVVPPGTLVNDVLTFRGPAAHRVRDVDVKLTRTIPVPGVAESAVMPDVQRFDRDGHAVGVAKPFAFFRVANKSADAVAARVVLLEYDDPPPGQPQQAISVTKLTGLLKLAPRASRGIDLPVRLRNRAVGSVKAYLSR
jgi:hypothetical protein